MWGVDQSVWALTRCDQAECSDGYVSAGRTCNLIATSSSSLDSSSSFPSASSLSTTLTPSLEVPPSPTTSEAPISTPVGVVGQAQFQTTQPVSTTSSTATTTTSSTTPMSSATTTTLPPPPTTMTSSSSSTTQPPPSTTEAPPPPSTTAATPTTTEPPSPTVTLIPDAVAAAGVTGFAGDNTSESDRSDEQLQLELTRRETRRDHLLVPRRFESR